MKTIKSVRCEGMNNIIVGRVDKWLEVRLGVQDDVTEFVFIEDSEKEDAYYEFIELDEGDILQDGSWSYLGSVFRYDLFHSYIFVRRLDPSFVPDWIKKPMLYEQMAMELN